MTLIEKQNRRLKEKPELNVFLRVFKHGAEYAVFTGMKKGASHKAPSLFTQNSAYLRAESGDRM
jgi:hypothetical protein